jgi:hypothetical protein
MDQWTNDNGPMDQWTNGPMNKCPLALALLAVFVIASLATSAQSKPDFSGTWVGVSPAEFAGQETQVRHTATTLSTGHAAEGGDHGATYKLDGSESRNQTPSHGEQIVTISKAVWDGNKIVITEASTYPDGRKSDSKSVWSIDGEGRLVIEHTRTIAGQTPFAVTLVHKKKDK